MVFLHNIFLSCLKPNRNCPRGQQFPTDIIELIEGLLSALQMRLKFLDSKASRYAASRSANLIDTRFWIGSKKFRDARIFKDIEDFWWIFCRFLAFFLPHVAQFSKYVVFEVHGFSKYTVFSRNPKPRKSRPCSSTALSQDFCVSDFVSGEVSRRSYISRNSSMEEHGCWAAKLLHKHNIAGQPS
jgi:hypothetical protein